MEWMRCNNDYCATKVGNRKSQFHVTQCGHVYCDSCVQKAEAQCFQCGEQGISLPLKEPLSPQIAHLFCRPADLTDKALQAQQFQESQVDLCFKLDGLKDKKYQALKEAYWNNAENLKKITQKYQKMKMAFAQMVQESTKMGSTQKTFISSQFQTPLNQINNSQRQAYVHYQNQRDFHTPSSRARNISTNNTNDTVFRKPTITRVPKSAGSTGYHTASSVSSRSSTSSFGNNM